MYLDEENIDDSSIEKSRVMIDSIASPTNLFTNDGGGKKQQ